MFWEDVKWSNMFIYDQVEPEVTDEEVFEEFFSHSGTNPGYQQLFLKYRKLRQQSGRKHLNWKFFSKYLEERANRMITIDFFETQQRTQDAFIDSSDS